MGPYRFKLTFKFYNSMRVNLKLQVKCISKVRISPRLSASVNRARFKDERLSVFLMETGLPVRDLRVDDAENRHRNA